MVVPIIPVESRAVTVTDLLPVVTVESTAPLMTPVALAMERPAGSEVADHVRVLTAPVVVPVTASGVIAVPTKPVWLAGLVTVTVLPLMVHEIVVVPLMPVESVAVTVVV